MSEDQALGTVTLTPDELPADAPASRNQPPDGGRLVARPTDEDDIVDEWGKQSFPASDPPANW
jgi:hypothetical protein